ncbi:MAG: S26 family signal peptidase, partial [Planctomycetes bacterium]|nr:S26 family signal peptidase [Planctomycetota bacterium]
HPSPARESIESLVVAFILAFLFRTFEAEAFVIPTGSMAETLNGRHKEVTCEQCGWHYNIGASQEVNGDSEYYLPHLRIDTSICPNCRFENEVRDLPVFHGDRILVNKFPYEVGDPRRWDVVVFKNPEEPMRNFIKRLVGLPNEFLRIDGGDVYARKSETEQWQILRKADPYKQLGLQMIVYNDDFPETALEERGWPERWAAVNHDRDQPDSFLTPDTDGWKRDDGSRSFTVTRNQSKEKHSWLRYRHFVPEEEAWEAAKNDLPFEPEPSPKLVSDFCGYNQVSPSRSRTPGVYWVGDLTIGMAVDITEAGDAGELLLELTEGVRDYQCRIELNSGKVTLEYFDYTLDQQKVLDEVTTSLSGPGSYTIIFANVDNRLCLWIDRKLIPFPSQGNYEAPATSLPTQRDLAPVGVAVRDAEVTVSHLKLTRDIYYRAEESLRLQRERFAREREMRNNFEVPQHASRSQLMFALDDPERYGELYLTHEHFVEFPQLKDDEFFVLGDNSPASLDSRLWDLTNAVPRHAMLGKAFFIYWPHGEPFLNGGNGYPLTYHTTVDNRGGQQVRVKDYTYPKLRYPFYPNIRRMERIR